jgi:two-component system cell cycle sensor histidine kinase/response regulator CckA
MDGEVLKQIFEPLYTTKKRGEGTGLGLTNVVDIVNKSGGTISVLSAPNEGTAFTLYLPRAVEIEGYYSLPDSVEESNIVSDGTLLVVEDDQAVRKVLVRSLLADGFRVIEAEDGEQGYQLALQHAAQIDLVITDVVMPTLGGPEMIRRLIVTFPDLKVIFVSGYADDRLDPSDLDKSRSEFLSKPYTFKEMRGLINKLLLIN